MASKVDILIKAKDQVSAVVDGITTSLGGLGDGAKEAESVSSDAFGNFMDKANETMLGVAGAIYVAKEAFKVLGEVYEGTVGKVLEIAGEIEEFVRISGDAPENMSLLRIEAEKASVPFDDLYKAMENLNKNGVAPTIENLMAIAQEYVNLQDPIAQAKLLTENFGSAGDEIAPMLEAIAGGVTAVQDAGSIFSEEDLQAARDHEEAVANLKIAWENFAITIGQKVIPALTNMFNQISDSSSISLLREQLGDVAEAARDAGQITKEEYNDIMLEAYDRSKTTGEAIEYLGSTIDDLSVDLNAEKEATEAVNKAHDDLIMSLFENSTSYSNFKQMMEEAGLSMGMLTEETYYAEKALRSVEIATRNATDDFQELNDTGVRGVKAIALEMELLEEQLANANLELAIQVRTFREDIGSQLYDMLRNAGLEGEDLESRIATLDTVLGTTFGKEYALELAIDDLFQQLLTDPEGFAEAFGSFEDAFFPLQESAQEAITKVMHLQSQLDALVGEYNATINITTNGSIPNIGGGGGGGGDVNIPGIWASGGVVNAAAGLSASLPYYWVGERGPEPFFPSVDGRIVSNTQAMAALRGGAGVNSREIANAVREGVKDAMRETKAGNVYNLTMPTSNNPADVRTAFELMEAWA